MWCGGSYDEVCGEGDGRWGEGSVREEVAVVSFLLLLIGLNNDIGCLDI